MTGSVIKITASDGSIYAAKTDDVQTIAELKEVASADSAEWKTFKAERKEWSITVSYLVGSGNIKADLLKVGKTVTVTIKERGVAVLQGSAIITACHITASVRSLVQGSFTFKGTGVLHTI